MKLRELMRPDPITITEVTRLGDAYRLMATHHIRHLPVVRDRKVIGMLSARDILGFRATTSFREDWERAPAASVMVQPPQTAGPDDSLTEAAGRLASTRIGALPIVERGVLIGIVTVTDVLEAEVSQAMR